MCEVKYLEYTRDGRLRAPVFLRIRSDKPARDLDDRPGDKRCLRRYRKKRDFTKTGEPAPEQLESEQATYVVQKHNARRIHFDFRLEHNGVLKSWAVPKGLSDDPQDKRLAIRTEDHPVAYATFSGVIREGEYGAGTVEIWDKGKFVNITIKGGKVQPLDEALEKGHFIIYLKGDKLNGSYAFTRLDNDEWIIIKKREKPRLSTYIDAREHRIKITHPEKELDKGITKAELVEYYRNVAPLMLPNVKDRFLSMFRFPEGVRGEKFFQKNIPDYFPDWIESKCLEHESGVTCYAIVKDEAAIVYIDQVVVPHITATRIDKPDLPDKLIFDLDPSQPELPSLKSAALKLKGFLEALGFRSLVMPQEVRATMSPSLSSASLIIGASEILPSRSLRPSQNKTPP